MHTYPPNITLPSSQDSMGWSFVLAWLTVFFAPWGAGLQNVFSFDISKVFVVLASLLIFIWLINSKHFFAQFPRFFNIFLLFVGLHTLLTYGLLVPQELQVGYVGKIDFGNEFVKNQEAQGMAIIRFILFALYAYALADHITSKSRLAKICVAYALGLFFVVMLSDFFQVTHRGSEVRFLGGGLNSNTFGFSAMIAAFLGLFLWTIASQKILYRLAALFSICVGLYGVFLSVSRGVILALLLGGVVIVLTIPSLSRRLVISAIMVIVTLIILFNLPQTTYETLLARTDLQRIEDDRASGRLDIWQDYLRQWPDYVLTGVGMGRTHTVTNKTHSTGLWRETHSEYLGLAVEYGLPGLTLFLLGLFSLGRRLYVPVSRRRMSHAVLIGLWSALSIMFIYGRYNSRALWIAYAVLAVCSHWSVQANKKVAPVCRFSTPHRSTAAVMPHPQPQY